MTSVHNPFQSLFAAPTALHFAANRTALLVVDMQYFLRLICLFRAAIWRWS